MFFCFNQNNSGGWFQMDDNVSHYVIVEADSADEANDRAESIGIYFDGCADERDCDCCGDRWDRAWSDDGDDMPVIYETPVADYHDIFAKPGKPYAHVYFRDGRKVSY